MRCSDECFYTITGRNTLLVIAENSRIWMRQQNRCASTSFEVRSILTCNINPFHCKIWCVHKLMLGNLVQLQPITRSIQGPYSCNRQAIPTCQPLHMPLTSTLWRLDKEANSDCYQSDNRHWDRCNKPSIGGLVLLCLSNFVCVDGNLGDCSAVCLGSLGPACCVDSNKSLGEIIVTKQDGHTTRLSQTARVARLIGGGVCVALPAALVVTLACSLSGDVACGGSRLQHLWTITRAPETGTVACPVCQKCDNCSLVCAADGILIIGRDTHSFAS